MKVSIKRESFWFANRLFGHRFIYYQRIIPLGFEGDYNILNTVLRIWPIFHFSTLDFDFPNSAVTMRSFADEKKQELWITLTKPLSWQIVNGKILVRTTDCMAIIPTFIYVK
jgi:hypothetical protein